MFLTLSKLLAVGLLVPTALPDDNVNQHSTANRPQERYRALVREHQDALSQFWQIYQAIRNAEARRRFYNQRYPRARLFIPKFTAIVDAAPHDDAAVDSLIWIVCNGGYDSAVDRAVVRLTQEYAASPRLGEVIPRLVPSLVHSLSPSAEDLFRTVIEKNPDHAAKGRACVALALYLKEEAALVRSLKGDSPEARHLRGYYLSEADKVLLEKAMRKDPAELDQDAVAASERTLKEFADVADYLQILAPAAQARLYDRGSPGIGTGAPHIKGEDIDGQPLDLLKFRGKVVMLLFWGDWSGPSRATYPRMRALVTRMNGKPFVLLGINSDTDRGSLRQRIKQENLPWRSWFEGSRAGPIASQFKIPGWPTIYLVDPRGIVRHKWLGPPDGEMFDSILDELIERATRDSAAGLPAGG